METEIWKYIEGFEGKYQVSNYGNVKSVFYRSSVNTKLLKLKFTKGYNRIGLSIFGKYKHYLVHRLVALAFIPNPENKKTVKPYRW